ncbi:uncharacterized protein FOMMEDRAFT_146881 [Fomitiporia mediterranea MF3/22]|uniref:uncharacterized protein n=1 Tax=Fomitiporia mediterranea (strain MF3/22) TaxID=694068 RepID=UPI0004408A13|nr:uncharacterized protein FOMMEDRAFT_146881 [Fomitiporia mediterranea MF3/22]EJD03261.1 hypothetical protein FOMMEDRAFT_146881 [Fomitiporia mediterranea MF3/22]
MPTLLDHVDRFTYTAQTIKSVTKAASELHPSPYVRAVLRTPLGDLARDVDTSELGLFTLVPDASPLSAPSDDVGASAAQKGSVARVEFPGATPLRKPAGASKHGRRENDKEPEVYAEAALKYLDRYQSIRPMPRARQEVVAIIERLNSIRSDIASLNETTDHKTEPDSQPEPTIHDEEKRIQELNMRIKQLKARKEVLLKKQNVHDSPAVEAAKDKEEDAFWSDPATSRKPRTGRKSLLIPTLARGTVGPDDSLLLDAHVKVDLGAMLGDVSMNSLADAAPTPLPPSRTTQTSGEKQKRDPASVPLPSCSPSPAPVSGLNGDASVEAPLVDDSINIADEGDTTVILTKPNRPPSPPPRAATPPAMPSTPSRAPETPGPQINATPGPGVTATPGTAKIGRVKITMDTERIAAKIWSTVGDIIMPGHPFNTAAAATTNKPPRAKETVALLQNLSTQKPPPASPAVSHSTLSFTTDPSTQSIHAILTAHLLLALINAVPRHGMPLAAAKAVLAEANKGLSSGAPVDPMDESLGLLGGGDKAMETRALYGCVAKRLLKIDRTGREQLVKFNV